MKIQLETARKLFYSTGLVAIAGGVLSLFFYAYLMVLHVDESGLWFNYTNKSYQYRFIFNPMSITHTLPVYLAKISLWMFGNTGIGLRFPVILFGVLSAGVLYIFVRKITGSRITGFISSALLFLNPYFLHYSHELRGYSAFLFFLICSYLCFINLLERGNKFLTWVMLFILFIACHIANLGAHIFFSVFLITVWIFIILRRLIPIGDRVAGFENIHIGSLFTFSAIAASFFAFLMFYVDRAIVSNTLAYHISESNYLSIPDLFSAFLGYKYLSDATSELYSYPTSIWLISLFSFLYGWWVYLKNRKWPAPVFLLMLVFNSLYYVLLQKWVPLRPSIYLLPFILLFQAYGLKIIVEMIVARFSLLENRDRFSYLLLAGILGCYFSFFSIGKYKNFEPTSGNPFELTRNYLENNIGPNDLIISSLYDTKGGFYLGGIIRRNNHNVYQNGRIENIYYLAPQTGESKIELAMAYPASKRIKFLPLDQFELMISYVNKGVRPSEVYIYKRNVGINPLVYFDQQNMLLPKYNGNYRKGCYKQADGQGIRIRCDRSPMACANRSLNFPNITKNDLQFILFRHVNDNGTRTNSFASLNSISQSRLSEKPIKEKKAFDPFPTVYMLNPLINNINDLDIYKENVDLIDISLQKMGNGKNALFCMQGKLFDGNSVIQGVKVFNWKQ